ncbi:alpha-glucosidase [Anopheles sinensis]|uniref:Alpha-glucosidase n=1 Tax=Anopheles sinensis TaxID=74873 RepID=A0A084W4K8_ANOSI|nr:alpha-glucosidase [Anopheles sinensis]
MEDPSKRFLSRDRNRKPFGIRPKIRLGTRSLGKPWVSSKTKTLYLPLEAQTGNQSFFHHHRFLLNVLSAELEMGVLEDQLGVWD